MKDVLFAIVMALVLTGAPACAQRSVVSDYNYRKAAEAIFEDHDPDKALELLDSQLDETPDHLDSRYLRSMVYQGKEKYDAALRDVEWAISHYRGKPRVYRSTLYGHKATILSEMDRDGEAAEFYRKAWKLSRRDNPDRVQDYMFDCANALHAAGDTLSAGRVYSEMLKRDPHDCAAMVGQARNAMDGGHFVSALSWLDRAGKYDVSYPEVYRFRMLVMDRMGRTDESVDAAVRYFGLDEDASFGYVAEYAGKHYSYAVAKVTTEMNRSEDPLRWMCLLAAIHENRGAYAEAVGIYDRIAAEYGGNTTLSMHLAECLAEAGEFSRAVAELTRLVEKDPEGTEWRGLRGDTYRSAGMYAEAIADYTGCIEREPSNGYFWYARGWSRELSGDPDGAMKDYNDGIDIDKDYPYIFLSRADLLVKRGETERAMADYEAVVAKDTVAYEGSCRQYALLGLHREDEASEWMDRILEKDPDLPGCWYDKSCLMARMGRLDEALDALETALEKGFRRFNHLEHDDDMDPLRGLARYWELIERYSSEMPQGNVTGGDAMESPHADVSEIGMKRMPGGTYEIPCTVNGLPLSFILDTGASDVTISSVEAGFMLKNDYLSGSDFRGKRNYMTASGEISEGTVINIREMKIGEMTLKNVSASVVRNQKAPLLLGQSVLERLGTVSVDNTNLLLTVTR